MSRGGRLFGVGVGPGDPELVTVKARRIVESADVIAYPGKAHGSSIARRVVAPYLRAEQTEIGLAYPVTTGATDHPEGYEGAVRDFYDAAAAQLAEHLERGRNVAVLCEGDPFLYGSYMYLHDRLAPRFLTEVVPGIAAFSAAAAAAGRPLVRRDDVLTILPGTLAPDVLAGHLAASDAAVVMKLGRTFPGVRAAVEQAGCLARGVYVERASSEAERVAPLAEVTGEVPYMSLVLLPSADPAPAEARDAVPGAGRVSVVGLGPGGAQWLTPEARTALAHAEHVLGYATYLRRVPVRPGQHRHASDNTEELARARHALTLAADGARVAVVSSGDPGIFAMAAAVLEAAEEPAHAGVAVEIVPGLSAMQAAAARVGAPLGHDFCVLSLSDRLKPWSAIERRLRAAGSADLVLALYNPASRTRRGQLERALAVLGEHRAPETPVVLARAVGAPEESVAVHPLGEVPVADVDMRTLLIVGSTRTRVSDGRVYTPRSMA